MVKNLANQLELRSPERRESLRDQHAARIRQLVLVRDSEQTRLSEKRLATALIPHLQTYTWSGVPNHFAIMTTDRLVFNVMERYQKIKLGAS